MKKKIVVVISSLVLILYFSLIIGFKLNKNNETKDEKVSNYQVSSYITENMRQSAGTCVADLFLSEEFTPQKIGKDADNIVLATVISLDGADPKGSLIGMTNGKLMVDSVLKGNLAQGQVVEYSKPGGLMKMSEWEATQPDAANDKRNYLRQQSGVNVDLDNTYINLMISGDIEIEAGKSYLIYLKENDSKYEIIGLENGLRELNVAQEDGIVTAQALDTSSLKIKNNKTGEYESLQNYIDTYINNN